MTKQITEQINAAATELLLNPYSNKIFGFGAGNKTAELTYNGRQSFFIIRMKEGGRMVKTKSTADEYTAASIIRRYLK
jgi:hypothetical protein